MKFFKLLVLLLISCMAATAQVGYYKPFSVGGGYGVTIAVAGEQTLTSSNAAYSNFSYYFTPFISASVEGQFGTLTGGDSQHDTFAKQFTNNFASITTHVDVQLGEFIDYGHNPLLNGLKNVYAGVGFGFLANSISQIQTVDPDTTNKSALTYLPVSVNFLVPLRVGYEFKIFNRYDEPNLRFDISYSFNTAFGAGLDGYTSIYTKSYVKFYNYISVGLKYNFGKTKSYRKPIYYEDF